MEEEEFMKAIEDAQKDIAEPEEEVEEEPDEWVEEDEEDEIEPTEYQEKKQGMTPEDNEMFQEGRRLMKEGKIKPFPGVKIMWVGKVVSNAEWNGRYSQTPTYCYLGKDKGGVRVGFAIGDNIIPPEHFELSDTDKQIVNDYRKSNNIRPLVYEETNNDRVQQTLKSFSL